MTKKFFLIFCLIFTFNLAIAQPGDPGGDPDNPVPITGIEYLLIAGGLFGARKLIKKK